MNILLLSLYFSSIISVIIIVIIHMIIVIKVLIIKIMMMMNTNIMLVMWKLYDQVGLLLLTYCHYHLFPIISVITIVIMDMIIVIKVLIIKIMMMINKIMMLAMWKLFLNFESFRHLKIENWTTGSWVTIFREK